MLLIFRCNTKLKTHINYFLHKQPQINNSLQQEHLLFKQRMGKMRIGQIPAKTTSSQPIDLQVFLKTKPL
jgi:hypothetical protein